MRDKIAEKIRENNQNPCPWECGTDGECGYCQNAGELADQILALINTKYIRRDAIVEGQVVQTRCKSFVLENCKTPGHDSDVNHFCNDFDNHCYSTRPATVQDCIDGKAVEG